VLKVKLGTQNRMYLQSKTGKMSFLKASLLQSLAVGVKVGQKSVLNVWYEEADKTVYHRYEGGPIWMATTPGEIGYPGNTLTIFPKLLTVEEFVDRFPTVDMPNEANLGWLPTRTKMVRLSEAGGLLRIEAEQWPPVEGISNFVLIAHCSSSLAFAPGLGCNLQASLIDFGGRKRQVRFYHDGHGPAWVGFQQGRRFPRVSLLSFDGVRLRVAYGSPRLRVASIYINNPNSIYTLRTEREEIHLRNNTPWKALAFYSVGLNRETEREMLRSRYRYPHGRLGTEIAHAISSRELGFHDLVLNDPAKGGPDMTAENGEVLFENRLVVITVAMGPKACEQQLLFQIDRLKRRVQSDLAYYRKAKRGFAILTYLNLRGLRSMVLETKK
jgi:hypothetical protein